MTARALTPARIRAADYGLTRLAQLNAAIVRGGRAATRATASFDRDRPVILRGYQWVADAFDAGQRDDGFVVHACASYPVAGSQLLLVRQSLSELAAWCDRGLAALGERGAVSLESKLRCLLAAAYLRMGRLVEAQALLERARKLARACGDGRAEAVAASNLGVVLMMLGDTGGALRCHRTAATWYRARNANREVAANLSAIGLIQNRRGNHRAARQSFTEALRIAREHGHPLDVATALGGLGTTYRLLGEPAIACEMQRQRFRLATTLGELKGQQNALGNLASALHDLGHNHEARTLAEQSLVLARRLGDVQAEGTDLYHLAGLAEEAGDIHLAISFSDRACESFAHVGDSHRLTSSLVLRGRLRWATHDYQTAIGDLERALVIREKTGDSRATDIRKTLRRWRPVFEKVNRDRESAQLPSRHP
jgi:tetratricopeptide (TPR) repeat protein